MPRGQKRKAHGHKKNPQARDDKQGCKQAQEVTAAEAIHEAAPSLPKAFAAQAGTPVGTNPPTEAVVPPALDEPEGRRAPSSAKAAAAPAAQTSAKGTGTTPIEAKAPVKAPAPSKKAIRGKVPASVKAPAMVTALAKAVEGAAPRETQAKGGKLPVSAKLAMAAPKAAASPPSLKAKATKSSPETVKKVAKSAPSPPAAGKSAAQAINSAAAKAIKARAAAVEEEEEKTSSKSLSPPAAFSWSPASTAHMRSPPLDALSVEGFWASFDNCSVLKDEESISQFSFSNAASSDEVRCPAELLEWFMLQKFHLKQFVVKEEMIRSLYLKETCEFTEIFRNACKHLQSFFGIDVREVDSTGHSYKLVSSLPLPNNGRIRPGRGYPKTGLVMEVLSLIVLNGHRAPEEEIWRFLSTMQIYPGKKHIMFGDPKKLFTQDLVRLKYLVYQQVAGSDPPRHEFLWGPEAYVDSNKEKILKFLITINKASPRYYLHLYEEGVKIIRELEMAQIA